VVTQIDVPEKTKEIMSENDFKSPLMPLKIKKIIKKNTKYSPAGLFHRSLVVLQIFYLRN
jgi:hypothetical protein